MARPTARVLTLLEILQGGGTRTVGDLAGRLGVDERTVRRYVAHLLDLDVPVESVRGRYGGYRLAPGFRMPPLMLTDAEALAVLLGMLAARRAGLTATAEPAVDSAVAKLLRVLPKPLAARLDAVLATAEFTGPERAAAGPEAKVLLDVAAAARDRQAIEIAYTGRGDHESVRTVHPYGIVAHNGHWYMAGLDSRSAEVRNFRLDRITRVTAAGSRFAVPDGFDPTAHLLGTIARTPWRHDVAVRVHGGEDEVRRRLPRGIATVEPIEDGWVRVHLRAERLDWVPRMLAGLDLPFVVEHPDGLRAEVRRLARRLLDAAD